MSIATRAADIVARLDGTLGIGALEDVQRHAVLDAAGEVERLVLGMDAVPHAAEFTIDFDEGRASGEALQGCKARGQGPRGRLRA